MIRAGVVGVGTMGRHHARVYTELDGVELVAIADPLPERARAVANRFKVAAYADPIALFEHERLDLVSVAVPTAVHFSVADAALARGINVLLEKPIAATQGEAERIIERARSADLILSIGHVERFNPAVIELKKRLNSGEFGQVFQIHSRRLSPFPRYVRDVGVVLDLATHELDILCYLLESEPETIFAKTSRWLHPTYEDAVFAILDFPGGTVAMLEANWLTPSKLRELRVTCQKGMFLVDYLSQDLYFYENSYHRSQWDTLALFRGMEEGNVVKVRLTKVEPLYAELASFADAVREHRAPLVSGQDGLNALRLADLLISSGGSGQTIHVANAS